MKYIEASELRIGNLVLINNKVINLDNKTFHAIINGFEGYDPEPIPLTEEWMLRFGFEQENGIMSYVIYDHSDVRIVYETLGNFYRLYPYTYKIRHVHQLQNLYFALTGIELTLK